ncbi:unnamed protein product, partial [Effrenium voratum]
ALGSTSDLDLPIPTTYWPHLKDSTAEQFIHNGKAPLTIYPAQKAAEDAGLNHM